jgi:3-phosphoshikimate 1-carboxyvinyltransferase
MGADLQITHPRVVGGEPVADLRIRSSELRGIEVPPELVPLAIDEFPAIFVAAACARGRTVVSGAEELRVKESDRIAVMAQGLTRLGIDARPTPDGMVIEGRGSEPGVFLGGEVDSHGDHRPAMSFALAALRARAPIRVQDTTNVATSFPGFAELAREAGLDISAESLQ